MGLKDAYKLELDWHYSKVDDLNQWPDHEVGLESRKIHVSEFVGYCSSSATLCDGHDCKKGSNSCYIVSFMSMTPYLNQDIPTGANIS